MLLVEDNPTSRDLCKETLLFFGCNTVVAENGKDALEILNSQKFDIILMSCHMPVLDGYEATRKLRQREKGRGAGVRP